MPGPGYRAPIFVLIPRSVARTSRSTPRTVHCFPSGPGGLDYGDAERAQQECFGELERQLTDMTQDAAEAEMHHDHNFHDREAGRDRHFGDNESRREANTRPVTTSLRQ